eukprot:Sdes_comp18750_c0_seq5m9128
MKLMSSDDKGEKMAAKSICTVCISLRASITEMMAMTKKTGPILQNAKNFPKTSPVQENPFSDALKQKISHILSKQHTRFVLYKGQFQGRKTAHRENAQTKDAIWCLSTNSGKLIV